MHNGAANPSELFLALLRPTYFVAVLDAVDTAELNLDLGNEAECQALYDCIRATIRKVGARLE